MKHTLYMTAVPALLLAFGSMLAGCDINVGGGGGDNNTFVAVTNITGAPTIAIKGRALSLSGTVEPFNATNRTIVWSGSGVSNGVFTASSVGSYMVTAAIVNGRAESVPYTRDFPIMVYEAGSSIGINPFGDDTTPIVWAVDGAGGETYVTITGSTWVAMDAGAVSDSGTYTWFIDTKTAEWKVGAGGHAGDTGIVVIRDDGTALVANLANTYSDMNGTLTRLNPALTLTGTWISGGPVFNGSYVKITAASGNFSEYLGSSGSGPWTEAVKGTYPTSGTTNPAFCTITQVNPSFVGGTNSWINWNDLSPEYKYILGNSQTFTVLVYDTKCETQGAVLLKQP
jgi:hypothetical protein